MLWRVCSSQCSQLVRARVLVDRTKMSVLSYISTELDRVENRFGVEYSLEWVASHWHYSIYISAVYVFLVFAGCKAMENRQPFDLRTALVMWNAGLAVFSFVGMTAVVPNLIGSIARGFSYSVCYTDSFATPPVAVWGWIYALSKIAELGDTAFIVLRKRPLPFLHWYHHVTVLVFTWYSVTSRMAILHWFGAINYIVHTFMYSYYFIIATGRKLPAFCAKAITILQLSQMFVAIFATLGSVWMVLVKGEGCRFHYNVFYATIVMYVSYAILFMNYFYQRYVRRRHNKSKQE